MARIPVVTAQVTPFAGGIDVQASPEAFGAQIGAARIGLGNSIGQLGSAVGSVGNALMAEQKSQARDTDNLAVATALASPEANFDKQYNDITLNNTDGNSVNPVSDAYMKHIDAVIAANPNMSAQAQQDLRLRMLQHAPVYNAAAADYDITQKIKTGGENIDEALDTQINSIRNGGGAETTTGITDPKTGVVTKQSRYDIAIQKGVDMINAQPIPQASKLEGIKKFKSQAAAARFDALMNAAITSRTDAPGLADSAVNDFRNDPRWAQDMTRGDYDATLSKLLEVQKQSKHSMQVRLKVQLQRLSVMGNDPSMGLATPTMIADAKRMVEEYGDDEDQANLATIETEWATRDANKFTPNSELIKKRDKVGGSTQPAPTGGPVSDAATYLMGRLSRDHRNQPYYITSMSPQLQTNLAALIQSAPPGIRENLIIVSGARSRGDQQRVLGGRQPSATVAGLNGPHVRGVAADLGWRGARGTWLPPEAKAWLRQNAGRFGMAISPWAPNPGQASHEAWHIELMGEGGQRISGNMRGAGGGSVVGGASGDTLTVASAGTPTSYRPMFEQTGAKYGVNPGLLASMGAAESNFNPNANSGEAYGLMQFTPDTARRYGVNVHDPASSIDGAGRYMRDLLKHYAGKSKGGYDSTALAVAAYNAGEGKVDMWLIGKATLPGETQNYVAKVLGGQAGALGASETGMGVMPSVASGGGYVSWDQFVQMQTYQKMIDGNNAAMKDDFMSYAASKGQDIGAVIDPTTGSLASNDAFAMRDEDYQTAVGKHNPLVTKDEPYPNPLTKAEAGAMVQIVSGHDEARQLDLMQHIASMSQPTQDAMLHQIGEDSAEGRAFAYAGAVYSRDKHIAQQLLHGHNLLANRELDFINSIGGSENVNKLFFKSAGNTLLGMSTDAQGVLKDAALSLFAANSKPGTKQPGQEDMDAAFANALGMQKVTINNTETLIPKGMDPVAVNKTVHSLDMDGWTNASANGQPPLDGDTGKPMSVEDLSVAGTLLPIDTKGHYKIVMEDGRIVVSKFPKDANDAGEAYVFTLTPELIKATLPETVATSGVVVPGGPGPANAPTPSGATIPGQPVPDTLSPVVLDQPAIEAPAGSMPPSALPPASPAPAPVPEAPGTGLGAVDTSGSAPAGPATPFLPPYATTPLATAPTAPPFGDPTGRPYQPQPTTRPGGDQPTFGPGSATGSGPASPRQFPSSEGMQGLDLTPQEQHLYDYHLKNITEGKTVKNADGSTSTLYQASVPHKGKWYLIPRVWNGKIVSENEAVKRASGKGWNYWPSYKTQEEAEARYNDMHGEMEKDVTVGENRAPPPPEPNPYKAPATPISPTGLPAISARARQSYHDALLSVGVEEGSDEMKSLLKMFDQTPTMKDMNTEPPSFVRPHR